MEAYSVIVANGHLSRTRTIETIIDQSEMLIVCDGAYNHLSNYTSRIPDVVIGDLDSIEKEVLKSHDIPLIHVADQETNDLTKAVHYGLNCGCRHFIVVGATGGRMDHSIGNVFLLGHYLSLGARVVMYGDKGIFFAFQGRLQGYVGKDRVVSIFSVDRVPINTVGLEYEVQDRVFDELWQGTLNRASSNYVELESEGRTIIYLGHQSSGFNALVHDIDDLELFET